MDFWQVHPGFGGFIFLICCTLFPRFTLAALVLIAGHLGITFWGFMGYIFVPRLTVAIIATTVYWSTNPFLCVVAWFCAFGGETTEKCVCAKRFRN